MSSTDVWKYDNTVEGFDKVYALSTKGGGDLAEICGLSYLPDFITADGGTADPGHWAQLDSWLSDYFYYIRGFKDANVNYSASQDDTGGISGEAADWLHMFDLDP